MKLRNNITDEKRELLDINVSPDKITLIIGDGLASEWVEYTSFDKLADEWRDARPQRNRR